MKKYLAFIRLGLMDAVAYRAEFFISAFGWGLRLFIALFLWKAVADASGGTVGGYTFLRIMQYFFIIQILSGFVFTRVGFEIVNDVYRGDFANYLLRPLNYLGFRLTYELSKNVFRTFCALLIFGTLLFFLYGGISLSLWKLGFLLIAAVGSYLINSFIVMSIGMLSFWVVSANRIIFIYFGMLTIFSGMIIPVDLFPTSIQNIMQYLPFPYIFFFPARVLLSDAPSMLLYNSLGIQWIYALVLGLMCYSLLRSGTRRFEGVGR
ncbi:ABC-2 family transporter protein [Candidatus Gracilibacteria bacterium]|nr:ABC-2 family transporter protein [Candidatus Gracilibacteria bacterium]